MARRWRFIDPASPDLTDPVVRLDLNDGVLWEMGRGLDLGVVDVRRGWLKGTAPGAISTGSARDLRTLQVPLILRGTITERVDAINALNAELDREMNAIEFRPHGYADSFVIDTYRAPIISLFRGQDSLDVERLSFDPENLVLIIPAHPILRGPAAQAYV